MDHPAVGLELPGQQQPEGGAFPLGIDGAEGDKAAAGRTAMLFSRTNTMLSMPMLWAMISAQNLF